MSTDRQEARAEAAAAKARAKALRPFYRKKRFIIPAALVVLIAIGMATSGGSKKTTASTTGTTSPGTKSVSASGSSPAAADVTIDSCEVDTFGEYTPKLTIVNHSSKRSNYLISISIVDGAGTKIGDGNASSENVEAGQTAKVTGFSTAKQTAGAKCTVATVTRYASAG